MKDTVRVAAIQSAPVYMNADATVEKACRLIAEAARDGAELVAFPETFVPGYPYWSIVRDATLIEDLRYRLHGEAVEGSGPRMEALASAARESGCHVVMGAHEKEGGTLYNTQFFIGAEGELLGRRRKLVPTNHERMVWGRGGGGDLEVFSSPLGTLGGLICYEHAQALFRYALQAQGEEIHVACWPGGMPGISSVIDAAVRHYAFEGQAFVICTTSILTQEILDAIGPEGSAGKLKPSGGSTMIVGPRGNVLAGPLADGEGILYADLTASSIVKAKGVVDCAGHYARPEVVQLLHHRDAGGPYLVIE